METSLIAPLCTCGHSCSWPLSAFQKMHRLEILNPLKISICKQESAKSSDLKCNFSPQRIVRKIELNTPMQQVQTAANP